MYCETIPATVLRNPFLFTPSLDSPLFINVVLNFRRHKNFAQFHPIEILNE